MVMVRTDKHPCLSHLRASICPMYFCVTCWYTLQKWKKSFHTHDIASYTAKRHPLVCWQASISVSWAVGGVCKVFACLLGSPLTSFGTELRIAALNSHRFIKLSYVAPRRSYT